jgi:hypothetical protein
MAAVTVQVYDLATGQFHAISGHFTGVFHGAVEVYGREYSFGGSADPNVAPETTGVFINDPKGCTMHKWRESVAMGNTALSEAEVHTLVEEMQIAWHALNYSLLEKNCCHFSEAFCERLGVTTQKPFPRWVNRAAKTGTAVVEGGKTLVKDVDELNEKLKITENVIKAAEEVGEGLERVASAASRMTGAQQGC